MEDNPSDEELTLHAFKTNHILNRMQVVRDGAQALDFVFARGAYSSNTVEKGPKLILLDVKLPKVDGLEVLRQIKDDPRTRDIPVVVLTSSQEETDLTAAYDRGANSYIVKPVNFEQFSEVMRKVGVYWLLLNQLPLRLGWAGDRY